MTPWPGCSCWFCQQGTPHPDDRHPRFHRVTGHLTVAESLDPADMISLEACLTCGQRRPC